MLEQTTNNHNRIIGSYEGDYRGPLLIAIGAMHGNEPAGVLALEEMFRMLEAEPNRNPQFEFHGKLLGLRGNIAAIKSNKRFINKDLNRQWTIANVQRIFSTPSDAKLDEEDLEIRDIINVIKKEIESYQPNKVVLIDFHTTSADDGIFSVPAENEISERIAVHLHAPVVRGMLNGVKGTSLQYFTKDNFGVEMTAICFESGQHNDPLSVKRAIAALTNCMRTIGCVDAEHIENRHDKILIEYSKDLPKIVNLIHCHSIKKEDQFEMAPGFKNFQFIPKGTVIAHDKNGTIKSPEDCRILMPLYQKQGDDGFFLVK